MKLRAVHHRAVRGPRVEVLRHDVKPIVMNLCRNIVDNSEENTRRIQQQDLLWKYDEVECLWYRAVRVQDAPPRWKGEVISGLPEQVGELKAFGSSESSLGVDLRFRYAHEVMAARLVRDWDEARERAAKTKFLCAETVR